MDPQAGLDTQAVSAEYARRAGAACAENAALALRVLERLDPARWPLEWHLPWWLGRELALQPDIARDLVVSNILGLAAIRLRDDLRDGDLKGTDEHAASLVSAALYEAAVQTYRSLFEPTSELWAELALRMAEWQSACDDGTAPPDLDADADGLTHFLARRGAPLKISAFAVCLLAGRTDVYGRVARYLDHVLAAMVLFDHVCDWQDDVAAGRWNAFVAAVSTTPQSLTNRERNRSDVLVALLAQAPVATYLERISIQLDRAAETAAQLEMTLLVGHVAAIREQIDAHAARLGEHYRSVGDEAVTRFFGSRRSDTWKANTRRTRA